MKGFVLVTLGFILGDAIGVHGLTSIGHKVANLFNF
jgi:hypothetical protein